MFLKLITRATIGSGLVAAAALGLNAVPSMIEASNEVPVFQIVMGVFGAITMLVILKLVVGLVGQIENVLLTREQRKALKSPSGAFPVLPLDQASIDANAEKLKTWLFTRQSSETALPSLAREWRAEQDKQRSETALPSLGLDWKAEQARMKEEATFLAEQKRKAVEASLPPDALGPSGPLGPQCDIGHPGSAPSPEQAVDDENEELMCSSLYEYINDEAKKWGHFPPKVSNQVDAAPPKAAENPTNSQGYGKSEADKKYLGMTVAIGGLQTSIAVIFGDIKELRSDVAALKHKVDKVECLCDGVDSRELRSDINALAPQVGEIEGLCDRVANLEDNHEIEIDDLRAQVSSLEDKFIELGWMDDRVEAKVEGLRKQYEGLDFSLNQVEADVQSHRTNIQRLDVLGRRWEEFLNNQEKADKDKPTEDMVAEKSLAELRCRCTAEDIAAYKNEVLAEPAYKPGYTFTYPKYLRKNYIYTDGPEPELPAYMSSGTGPTYTKTPYRIVANGPIRLRTKDPLGEHVFGTPYASSTRPAGANIAAVYKTTSDHQDREIYWFLGKYSSSNTDSWYAWDADRFDLIPDDPTPEPEPPTEAEPKFIGFAGPTNTVDSLNRSCSIAEKGPWHVRVVHSTDCADHPHEARLLRFGDTVEAVYLDTRDRYWFPVLRRENSWNYLRAANVTRLVATEVKDEEASPVVAEKDEPKLWMSHTGLTSTISDKTPLGYYIKHEGSWRLRTRWVLRTDKQIPADTVLEAKYVTGHKDPSAGTAEYYWVLGKALDGAGADYWYAFHADNVEVLPDEPAPEATPKVEPQAPLIWVGDFQRNNISPIAGHRVETETRRRLRACRTIKDPEGNVIAEANAYFEARFTTFGPLYQVHGQAKCTYYWVRIKNASTGQSRYMAVTELDIVQD